VSVVVAALLVADLQAAGMVEPEPDN